MFDAYLCARDTTSTRMNESTNEDVRVEISVYQEKTWVLLGSVSTLYGGDTVRSSELL